jgi:hypothetical protein
VWLAGLLLVCLASAHATAGDAVFSQIDSIVKSISDITGLPEKHSVPYGRMSKRQLRQFLNKRIKKSLKPEEIYADELALKMFGFVPQDFDLRKSTVDLLTEQAAAFYDYDEKKLFLMEDSSVVGDTVTLAHELTHALADQHFHLNNFMDDTPASDDENLAHSAVVEGEATWVMLAYGLKQAGQPAIPTPEMIRSMSSSGQSSMAEFPVLREAPLYIQQSLLFPYSYGAAFFDAVYRKLGKRAFTEVFAHPPVDSAQIIHPDRYFAHEQPARPPLPPLPSKRSGVITDGSVGEFDHQMLIRAYVGEQEATLLAPHVRGGQFKILSTGDGHRPVLEYSSEWDSPDNAVRFSRAYEKILCGKWKVCDVTVKEDGMLAGSGDNGLFIARCKGRTFSSVEGLSSEAEWRDLKTAWSAEWQAQVVVPKKTLPAVIAAAPSRTTLRYTEVGENREDCCRFSIERRTPGLLPDSCRAAEGTRAGVHHTRPGAEAAQSIPREGGSSRVYLHDVPSLPGGFQSNDQIPAGVWTARTSGPGHRCE